MIFIFGVYETLSQTRVNKERNTILTLTPKSTDVELQMAPMLAAANMASTAWIPLGR